jgi:hypothetical protein
MSEFRLAWVGSAPPLPILRFCTQNYDFPRFRALNCSRRLKREARLSGPLALVLAGSGRDQESLAVSNLPSIALTPAHLTGWTGSLTRTAAWGHVVRRCPDASCSTARERRSAATGLSPLVWSRKVMPRANFAHGHRQQISVTEDAAGASRAGSRGPHVRSRKTPL